MDKKEYNTHYEEMANKIADLIDKNEAPWQKPWEGGSAYLPYNIKTGKEYQGVNIFVLLDTPYRDPRWLSFNQANELGGKVRAGEKGQKIIYFQTTEKIKDTDKDGNMVETNVLLERPKAFWSTVFNAEQCENIPKLEFEQQNKYEWQPIEKAQEVIDKSGAIINHKASARAFYDINEDTITLPLKDQFKTPENYYQTALHELGHWTGHEQRLNRNLENIKNKKETHAREELVAEITSFMTGSLTGLGHEPNPNTLAYLKSWSKYIREDPKYLVKACQEADKASKFLLGDLKQELNQMRENITMTKINETKLEKEERVYINVPIEEKDEAKALGARWDRNVKSWFVPDVKNINLFQKWEQNSAVLQMSIDEPEKFYLAVPYKEKDEAKALGAKWDNANQSWYCFKDDKENFAKWFVENTLNVKADIPLDSKNEFLEKIKEGGITENELIADGNKHRIAVEGDKGSEKSGFYVFHSDGIPNGYFMNNRTGQEIKWIQKGYNLTNEEKTNLKTLSNAKNAERKKQQDEAEKKAVEKLRTYFSTAKNISNEKPEYLTKKEIQPTGNIFVSPFGGIAVPLMNIKGEIVSAQYINEKGEKRFAADTKKSGAFHLIEGSLNDIKKDSSVIIAEGYSTANTIATSLNNSVPVIASMGAANIENTIVALKEKYEDLKIIIAVDNDADLTKKGLQNIGLNAGTKAAEKYENVSIVIPKLNNKIFAGDFNDLFVKNENKAEATTNIANLFKKELHKTKLKEPAIKHEHENTFVNTRV